jgi:hypothetical protein
MHGVHREHVAGAVQERTCRQLRESIDQGPRAVMQRLFEDYLLARLETRRRGSKPASSSSSTRGRSSATGHSGGRGGGRSRGRFGRGGGGDRCGPSAGAVAVCCYSIISF